jgi:predicted ATPase/DNA-binding SARP family transcriptional activator
MPIMGSLRVLGTVEIRSDGVPRLAAGAARTRRLLALLTLRAGQPVSVDAVAETLWGEDQPDHPAASVQTLVSRLRRLLADTPGVDVLTTAGGYLLAVDDDALDVRRFEELAARGARLLDEDPVAAAEILDEALALWTGDAFGELAEEEPFRAEAARLEELRATAVEDRAEAGLRLGRHHEVAARLEPLVAAAPLRERRRAQLILARHRAGRTADALAAYQDYRDVLVEELGLEPSAALQSLHAAVLRDDPELAWRPTPTPAQPAPVPRPPAPGPALVGRDRAIEEVTQAVTAGGVVTLIGPGGVGKSSLARVVAAAVSATLEDGAYVVDLGPVTDPVTVPHAVASSLDIPVGVGADAAEHVTAWLAPQQALLVLDNCEHLLDAVCVLAEAVRRSAPDVRVLLTSQTPVGLPDEQLIAVPPLPVEAPDGTGRPGPAVELFLARARSHDPAFALTSENADDVAAVCRRLDGLPLAVELAAARVRGMTPSELAARLSGRFRLLHGGRRTARDRHRTLRALVDWSYGLLEPRQQRAFEVLSVFAGRFTLDQAERLLPQGLPDSDLDAGDAADLVLTLVDRSMVMSRPGSPTTYRMLETLRAYGRERLAERGESDRVHAAHARLVADLVGQTRHRLLGPQYPDDVALVARTLDEMRVAFAWAAEHDRVTAATVVAGGAGLVELRMNAEVPHWARDLLAGPLSLPGHGVPDDLVAWVYGVAASGSRFAAELEGADALAARAAQLAVEPATRAYAANLRSEAAFFSGRTKEAVVHIDTVEALEGVEVPPEWRALFQVERALHAAYDRGDVAAAVAYAEEGRSLASRHRSAVAGAWATYARGEVVLESDPAAATPYLASAVEQAEAAGDRYLDGVALLSLASARARTGDTVEAAALFHRAVGQWRRAGNWTHQWTTLRNAVVLLTRAGRLEEAARLDGALEARGVSAQATGPEAERVRRTRDELVQRLGRDGYDAAARAGAATSDGELVETVLDQLAAAAGSGRPARVS